MKIKEERIGDDEDEESEMEYEQKYVPEHPYCTNWPVNKRKEKNEDI